MVGSTLAGCVRPVQPAFSEPEAGQNAEAAADPAAANRPQAEAGASPGDAPDNTSAAQAAPARAPGANATAADPAAPMDAVRRPRAVIGLVDTGINPYHEEFRDGGPRAFQHPSTYLDGYPANATPIQLTLDAPDLETALRNDCAEWASVEPRRLYWFPGTRIVGAILLPDEPGLVDLTTKYPALDCTDGNVTLPSRLFGDRGHGTMVASRAAGRNTGACPECLVGMVQDPGHRGVAWLAEQAWVDVQSNAWGTHVTAPVPSGSPWPATGTDSSMMETIERAAEGMPVFFAAGNGIQDQFGGVGHPTTLNPLYTPSVLRVGGHDNGRVTLWPGLVPDVVADACWSPAAVHESLDGIDPRGGSGTSAASPFAAGLMARVLLDLRSALGAPETRAEGRGLVATGAPAEAGPLADGRITMDEVIEAFLRTADPRPKPTSHDGVPCDPTEEPVMLPVSPTPVTWTDVPDGPAGVPFIGYGQVTADTAAKAVAVLLGRDVAPDRSVEEKFFEQERAARQAQHDAYTKLP